MIDREKVIKGLEMCIADVGCHGCPYEDECYSEDRCEQFSEPMMRDALALLKEQDAEIRQLRLALDIAKGTCNGIKVERSVEM